jgi:hypothetical protein
MNRFSLNAVGQHYVTEFVANKAKDGANAEAFFADAEADADDAFARDMLAVLEIRASMSYDGKPHTLTLDQAWFDTRA